MPRAATNPAAFLVVAACLVTVAPAAEESASQDVLAAERAGLAEVRYIPNDSRSAQVIVSNRSDRPLTLRLPAAFAGIPVLAQLGPNQAGVGNNNAGFGAGGIGAAPQAVGGGGGGMMGGGGGMGQMPFCWVAREVYGAHDPRWVEFRTWMTVDAPSWLREGYVDHGAAVADWIHDRPVAKRILRTGMDAAIGGAAAAGGGGQFQVAAVTDGSFVVQPGKQRVFRFATVCLEHGKPEPSPRMPYRLVELASFSADPRLPAVMAALAGGQVSQKAAQAAAWHITDGLSWERLAAEKIDHAGGDPDEPFFAPADLAAARRLVAAAGPAKQAPVTSSPE